MDSPKVIDLHPCPDDRGILMPIWNHMADKEIIDDYAGNAGVNLSDVARVYFIKNSQKGIIRGFHYHEHERKYFVVLRGMAKFATVKLSKLEAEEIKEHCDRWDNPNHAVKSFVLSDYRPQMCIVPPGYANGWTSLTDDCLLLALSSSTFEQSKNDDVRIDPYAFGDVWTPLAR